MSNKTLDQLLTIFTLLLDVCFISASIFLAYWLRFESGWLDGVAIHKGAPPPLDYYFQLVPLMGFIWILALRGVGLYRIEGHITLETVASISKAGVIASIATLGAIFFIYHNHQYSRWVMILSCGVSIVLLLCFSRLTIQRFKAAIQQLGVGINRVAVVGFNRTTQQLITRSKRRQATATNLSAFCSVNSLPHSRSLTAFLVSSQRFGASSRNIGLMSFSLPHRRFPTQRFCRL